MNWKFWKSEKKEEGPVQVGWQGKEVYVNPALPQRLSRNLARIETIKQVLASMAANDPTRASFEKELKRRELEVQLAELQREGK